MTGVEIRAVLRETHGDNCWVCGEPMDFSTTAYGLPLSNGRETNPRPLSATIEHMKPTSLGGKHHFDNLRLTHSKCNALRKKLSAHSVKTSIKRQVRLREFALPQDMYTYIRKQLIHTGALERYEIEGCDGDGERGEHRIVGLHLDDIILTGEDVRLKQDYGPLARELNIANNGRAKVMP